MALDQTDKQLVNGAIIFAIFGAVAYFLPSYGYKELADQESRSRDELENVSKEYVKHYDPMHPGHLGLTSLTPVEPLQGVLDLAQLKKAYSTSIGDTDVSVKAREEISRMAFPKWTEVPESEQRDPGIYWMNIWQKDRLKYMDECRRNAVDCMDPDIGFQRFSGVIRTFDVAKTQELNRELHIAEKVITLCIEAKVAQEKHEREQGVQPEAFMRIIKIEPKDSEATGPSTLEVNPQYTPSETNPNSPRFRKYKIRYGRNFIQEYPVEFELQCDINTFMRFLYTVRAKDQFLVIRNLSIISPLIEDSAHDKTEGGIFHGGEGLSSDAKKLKFKDEHVYVKMSAAGMDFFNPDEKNTLYPKKQEGSARPTGRTGRRRLGSAPDARSTQPQQQP